MPELPEVQTVVDSLARKITGKVFELAEVKVPKMVSKNFKRFIKNKKVKKVYRRAKMVVMELASGESIIGHLKMTGQLIFVDKKGKAVGGGHPLESKDIDLTKPNKFTRIILNFQDQSRLLFHDVRKFGWIRLVTKQELEKIFARHGLEPLGKEFTLIKFREILKRRPNLKIKQLLMTQELIAGIGNIYADESLFASGIRPERKAGSLKQAEIVKLHKAIIRKLKAAVKLGGTSVNTFVNADGERGRFVERLKVYRRGGLRCLGCNSVLKKIKIGGRGTVYCSKCQK